MQIAGTTAQQLLPNSDLALAKRDMVGFGPSYTSNDTELLELSPAQLLDKYV